MDDLEKELRVFLQHDSHVRKAMKEDPQYESALEMDEPVRDLLTRCLEAIAWKSVEDGLPEKFEWVLIKIKYGDSPAVASLDKDSDWFVDTEHVNCDGGWDGCTTHSDIENGQVTHWKPITPKGGD